jgi:serine/threonine protein phosphatase PrpC
MKAAQSMPFLLQAAVLTDTGCVRERNEDAFLADVERGLFIVADGMGGRRGGDVAAHLAVKSVQAIIRERLASGIAPRPEDLDDLSGLLEGAAMAASKAIQVEGLAKMEYLGMGAAIVAALVAGGHVHIAHMGDSRAYLLREDELRRLTDDHTIVGALLRHGEISPEEAVDHPARGRLTRFAGMEPTAEPSMRSVALEAGDRLVLCTDGLWGAVGDVEMGRILSRPVGCDAACRVLIDAGRAEGGEDNLTAVVVDVRSCPNDGNAEDEPR